MRFRRLRALVAPSYVESIYSIDDTSISHVDASLSVVKKGMSPVAKMAVRGSAFLEPDFPARPLRLKTMSFIRGNRGFIAASAHHLEGPLVYAATAVQIRIQPKRETVSGGLHSGR